MSVHNLYKKITIDYLCHCFCTIYLCLRLYTFHNIDDNNRAIAEPDSCTNF